MHKTCYLAGPIRGLSYDGATDWREHVQKELADVGICARSPMRGKQYLASEAVLENDYPQPLSTPAAIVARDRFDVQTCDLMLANLLGASSVSIGTMVEYGWADAFRTPIVTVIDEQGGWHDHPFVRQLSGWVVQSVDEGIDIVKAILL